jgi:hypothetical protein
MRALTLRNDRSQRGVWLFTLLAFAVLGAAMLIGLAVMNVRDPKALWMGPQVKAPQAVYLFLEAYDGAMCLLTAPWSTPKSRSVASSPRTKRSRVGSDQRLVAFRWLTQRATGARTSSTETFACP